MRMRTSVSPDGTFRFGIHKPSYCVKNLRQRTIIARLGSDDNGTVVENRPNYPDNDIEVDQADWIYEVANPFPFRGTTFIGKSWADRSADNYDRIRLPPPPAVSMSETLKKNNLSEDLISSLPRPILLSLATTSTDPEDLIRLAHLSCSFETDPEGRPVGLIYNIKHQKQLKAVVADPELFEAVANNPTLPDPYKTAMVVKPGAQGTSEIVGDYHAGNTTHVYEYLRKNSYIGGGHYAANMADDAIRYSIDSLDPEDMFGLRHLYYQRTYRRLADTLDITLQDKPLSPKDLDDVRVKIISHKKFQELEQAATLWGWNFGFDYAPSGYRLHASHQQIHHQYALIPDTVATYTNDLSPASTDQQSFSCGIMIEEVIDHYRNEFAQDFFKDYLRAIINNKRLDGRTDRNQNLVIWEDNNVMLFVPKAQTSQWEMQLMTKPKEDGCWPGNILETDLTTRNSLDSGLLKAQQCLAGLGARMVTSIEFSKRFNSDKTTQPLIYCLMPKLPQSPGAFSEAQLRFINGHYPEDFAVVCQKSLAEKRLPFSVRDDA